MFKGGSMKKVVLALALMVSAAPVALAQMNQPTAGASPEEKGTQPPIQSTPVPGTSTTGHASGPGGTSNSPATAGQSHTGTGGQNAMGGSGRTKPMKTQ